MNLKYNVYSLNNSQGTGKNIQYVRLIQDEPLTAKQLQQKIQDRCSLTRGDVVAVLSELHDMAIHEFQMGHRFYIPGLGYFSMSASLEMPEDNPDKKITGKEVQLTGINFRPEAGFLQELQQGLHYVRSQQPNQSVEYTADALLAKVKEYLHYHSYITARVLRLEFGLTQYMTNKWLRYFCDCGSLVKQGTAHSPIYVLP